MLPRVCCSAHLVFVRARISFHSDTCIWRKNNYCRFFGRFASDFLKLQSLSRLFEVVLENSIRTRTELKELVEEKGRIESAQLEKNIFGVNEHFRQLLYRFSYGRFFDLWQTWISRDFYIGFTMV